MGFAAPANDELANTITVGEYLLRDKDASYLLQMRGDAMQDSGILDGDMVVFERTGTYKPNDLVVVLDEDGYKLSYVKKDARIEGIIGIVTGSFRKYV
jgi:DNA polymerase V